MQTNTDQACTFRKDAKPVLARLTRPQRERLERRAEADMVPMSQLVRRYIDEGLSRDDAQKRESMAVGEEA